MRYTDFGKTNYLIDPPSFAFNAGFHETTALLGISYLFRAPPPPVVAARY